uniref:BTB domain-containing protein n=1 Tax=Panagrolaimus sp. ES5 TaxID=591445 RepID=A0AC34GU27_9BILA
MDLSVDLQVATTSSSNRKRKAADSINVGSSKKIHFTGPYGRQEWSLPDSIIYYMAMNPKSAEVYQKLVKSCKYFYIKNSILVVKRLKYEKEKWKISCGKETINMGNVTLKIWITDVFDVTAFSNVSQKTASSIIPNIYKCDAKSVYLYDQVISFQDFCFLASNVYFVSFSNTTVKNEDLSILEFEKLFLTFSKAHYVVFDCENSIIPMITSKTFDELLKIRHFSTLKYLNLTNIPETFDLDAFYGYMKKNKLTTFSLHFCGAISEAYKNRIEEIIDEILSTKNHDYKPPFLDFPGLRFQKYLDQLSFSN